MSNTLINAVIALVEERPKDAREMLRNPALKVSVTEVQNRLTKALRERENKAKIEVLKQVIGTTLRIDGDFVGIDLREAYLQGVAAVEEIIDHAIDELES